MIFKHLDRIVFAGDSVTDMGSVQPVGEGLFDNMGRGYPRVIENMIASVYPELSIRFTNSGISGNTSKDLLNRFQRDVIDMNPDWVSICIGINDVWRQYDTPAMTDYAVTPEEYEANMREMIEPHMFLVDYVSEVYKELDIEGHIIPCRGGTDGARLSFMGLPCPNLGTGCHNCHGHFEYAVVESMEVMVDVIIKLAQKFTK